MVRQFSSLRLLYVEFPTLTWYQSLRVKGSRVFFLRPFLPWSVCQYLCGSLLPIPETEGCLENFPSKFACAPIPIATTVLQAPMSATFERDFLLY